MDDFVISSLHESRNEWCARLVSLLTPPIIEGIRSMFNEALKMCEENNEASKYLMTFQNLLARVSKWNSVIVEQERKRIVEKSGCAYLEDLIACVHIIQLKALTCIRVGNKQKKIDISIPKLDHFIQRVYLNVARKLYSNVYLFQLNLTDLLQVQKHNRETEIIVQECILMSIRESIPTEAIIRAYLDENEEQEEEVTIEPIVEEQVPEKISDKMPEKVLDKKDDVLPPILSVHNLNDEKVVTKLSFNPIDQLSDGSTIHAPKTLERLEEISEKRNAERKREEEDEERIKIHMDHDVVLTGVLDLDQGLVKEEPAPNIEVEDL